ncbi:hypothetical protein NF867_16780 [Solitalea sp. MAHUQ-68]|uniref:Uncharacterized protein n=1 Tax=Solitalea agri TaxID=2953739 RepID=A0A9X2JF21_9SPHI|nr:hypothetical protein [Solitalea agri]MCO4294520.1 hypothetical protein [Solitalea agri]
METKVKLLAVFSEETHLFFEDFNSDKLWAQSKNVHKDTTNNKGYDWDIKEFNTQGEADAFYQGLSAGNGWKSQVYTESRLSENTLVTEQAHKRPRTPKLPKELSDLLTYILENGCDEESYKKVTFLLKQLEKPSRHKCGCIMHIDENEKNEETNSTL